jgi:hypothetical protein
MNPVRRHAIVAAHALLFLPALAVGRTESEILAQKGRDVEAHSAGAVVSVELVAVLRGTMGGKAMPPHEQKIMVDGTVLAESGLTVTALSVVDPKMMQESMASVRGAKVEFAETEFKDVTLRLSNNTEVPAAIVLRDPDLNLVFVAPIPGKVTPAPKFSHVDLSNEAKAVVLGDYFVVTRAAKEFQRMPLVFPVTIVGIVERPRTKYLISSQVAGAPAFDPDGKILGIGTVDFSSGHASGIINLPSRDVAELAKQAAAVKPEEKLAEDAQGKDKAPAAAQPAAAPAADKP